jgi:transcriptional regulator with XRE-family HTH domain
MAVKDLDKKLNALLDKGENTWEIKARERQANKSSLKHSRRIALKINFFLRENKLKQKDLAKLLNVSPQQVSKIIKGRENLTLETISKIENVLKTELLKVDEPFKKEVSFQSQMKYHYQPRLNNSNKFQFTTQKKVLKIKRISLQNR